MPRVKFNDLEQKFKRILIGRGFSEENANKAASIIAQSAADGVYSHSVNRFPRIISYIDKGFIHPEVIIEKVNGFGSFERYDGHFGLGCLNASFCMERACQLAKEHGIGIVTIKNTNHWLRAGSYGWQAANNGFIGICWTNTMPNMPVWGARDSRIGNNPIVFAVPKSDGKHIVVDCALSQFSYGKIEETRLKGHELPVPGGYDLDGNMTTNPSEIEKTGRLLQTGYWKGSGLSIALDLIAAILSGGNSVTDIGRQQEEETGLSQVMIAIDPSHFNSVEFTDSIIANVIQDIHGSKAIKEDGSIYYPGERTIKTREDNMVNGIPIVDEVWNKLEALDSNKV